MKCLLLEGKRGQNCNPDCHPQLHCRECLEKDFWVIPPLFVDLAELGSQLDLTLNVFSNLKVSTILKFPV